MRVITNATSFILLTSILCAPAPVSATQPRLPEAVIEEIRPVSFAERCKPIADLIARGEGDWNAVNRGYAGDTPGGIRSITGKTFAQHTVGEVLSMQRYRIYAVGRYQFIPGTLRQAVSWAGIKHSDLFTPETQDKLLAALLEHKRPAVGAYLRGGGSLQRALDELAREWASLPYRNGGSYYAGRNGNRSHVTIDEVVVALNKGRAL